MLRFYICRTCGNLIEMVDDSGINPVCCDEEMELLVPGSSDGIKEKHTPVYSVVEHAQNDCDDDSCSPCTQTLTVKVGDIPHPMDPNHHIQWIVVLTDKGIYRKDIHSCKTACADFCLMKDEKLKAIYSYCNLHGLWVNAVK